MKFDNILKKVLKNRPAAIIILAITMTDATIMIKTKKMPIISTKTAIATPSSVKQLCVRKTLDRTFLTIEETLGVIVTQEIVITGRKFARAPQTNKVISSKEIMVVETILRQVEVDLATRYHTTEMVQKIVSITYLQEAAIIKTTAACKIMLRALPFVKGRDHVHRHLLAPTTITIK